MSDEADQQETLIRRHFEEMRLRLEQDHNRLIQELEMSRNGKIKELKKVVSELQATAVKLGSQHQELEKTLVSGTDVEVIDECVNDTSATRLDLLSMIEEPGNYPKSKFTRSALLEQADNLVGQLTTDSDASKLNNNN